MTDIAKLVFEIDSTQAVQARKNLDDLTKSSDRVETSARKVRTASEQAGIGISSSSSATARATKTATEHAMAMSQAEKVMRGALVTRGESITLLLRNSQVQAKAAADEISAAKSAASATAKAEQERAAAWRQSQAVQAQIMRERVALARSAEREEIAAAKAASAAKQQADRDAAQVAANAAKERTQAWRQAQRIEAEIMRERVSLTRAAEAEEAKAAKTTASYTAKVDRLRATLDPFAAIQTTLAQRTKLLDDAMRAGAISADQHAAMLSKVTRAASSGLLGVEKYSGGLKNGGQYATQFSFQLNDIVTGLVSGQKPMQILAQQGGQVFQIFQMAAMEAGGFKAAIKALTAEVLPLLATFGPWIAGLTAIGAAVFYVVDQHKKQAQAVEDATKRLEDQAKALGQISPLLSQSKMASDLAAEGQRNFDEHVRKTNVSLAEQIRLQRIATLNETNDALRKAGEELRKNQEIYDKLNKPGAQMGFSTGVGGFSTISAATTVNKESELYKKAAANLKEAQDKVDLLNQRLSKQGQAPDEWFGKYSDGATKATTAVRAVAAATEDYSRRAAPIIEDQLIKAAEIYWPEAAAAAEAYKKQQDAVKAAANDNIKTMQEQIGQTVRFSSTLEKLAYDLEDAAAISRGLSYDIEDIAYAINNNDWTSAFAGLSRVLLQVKAAFDQGATSAQKYAAAAGVAQAVGGAVGGTGGAAISGAASGAMTGATIGSVIPGVGTAVGAVVGGIIGGIGGILGSSSAKKKARQQAAAQAAAEEAQRQQQIADYTSQFQIDTLRAGGTPAGEAAAVAMERAAELAALAKLSPALVDLKQKYYDAADAATAAAKAAEEQAKADELAARNKASQRSIILDLMAMDDAVLGTNSAVLAQRADELALLDPVSRALKEIYYARLDEADALAKTAKAAEDAAAAVKDAYAEQSRIADYLAGESLSKVTAAYEAQAAAAKSTGEALAGAINQFTDWSNSLKAFSDSLNGELGGSGVASYGTAKQRLISASQAGDYANIEALGRAFLEASKATSTSTAGYRSDVALVQSLAGTASSNAAAMPEKIAALLRGATGFATGGSFEVGGSGAPDSKLFNLALSPGEMVNVSRPGGDASNDNDMAAVVAELKALRTQVADLQSSNKEMARTLTNVTEGGRAMQTEVAS